MQLEDLIINLEKKSLNGSNLERAAYRIGMLLELNTKLAIRNNPYNPRRFNGVRKAGLVDTGRLLNSIQFRVTTSANQATVTVGSYGVSYAAIHEFGGVIQGKPFLTIPVQTWSKGRRAKDFQLFKPKGKNILVDSQRLAATGDIRSSTAFVLARRAVIPPRPYLQPAIKRSTLAIEKILQQELGI